MELSPSSSFNLTNSFCTLSKCRFIRHNCALRELVESEERVSSSGRWGVLVAGDDLSTVVPRGPEGSFEEGYRPSSSSRRGTGGHPSQARGSDSTFREVCYWEEEEGLSSGLGSLLGDKGLFPGSLRVPPNSGYSGGIYTCGSKGGCTETINADGVLDRLDGIVSHRALSSPVPGASVGRIRA
ncbi:hypothetical protein B296_00012991 [Ensete ventricosum]|uniref:Uncharacterized protein n=1 Tax=Ensete ventricosum TaxID=4639 RepID=A0A427AI63_ENSVE|nr:hypothetical protein B296_00012991 [Ensete ventricosum]